MGGFLVPTTNLWRYKCSHNSLRACVRAFRTPRNLSPTSIFFFSLSFSSIYPSSHQFNHNS